MDSVEELIGGMKDEEGLKDETTVAFDENGFATGALKFDHDSDQLAEVNAVKLKKYIEMMAHRQNEMKALTHCLFCQMSFKDPSQLESHILKRMCTKMKVDTRRMELSCPICKEKQPYPNHLQCHLYKEHLWDSYIIACRICSKSVVVNPDTIKQHIYDYHFGIDQHLFDFQELQNKLNGPKEPCPKCGEEFHHFSGKFIRHRRMEHSQKHTMTKR